MRGRRDPQAAMLAFVDLEERVPQDHPIRTIKPGVSILGVLMLKGQPNRDSGMIFRLKTSRLPGTTIEEPTPRITERSIAGSAAPDGLPS